MFLLDEIFSSELRSRVALADVFLKLGGLVQSKDDLEKCKIPKKRAGWKWKWATKEKKRRNWPLRELRGYLAIREAVQRLALLFHPLHSAHLGAVYKYRSFCESLEKYKNLFLQLGRHLSQVEVQDREPSACDVALSQPIDHQHRPHWALSLPVPSDCTTKEIYELLHG